MTQAFISSEILSSHTDTVCSFKGLLTFTFSMKGLVRCEEPEPASAYNLRLAKMHRARTVSPGGCHSHRGLPFNEESFLDLLEFQCVNCFHLLKRKGQFNIRKCSPHPLRT